MATVAAIEDIALPRLRAAGRGGVDVIDRLDAVLDESDQLMREYPYLAAFERAIRAESAAFVRRKPPRPCRIRGVTGHHRRHYRRRPTRGRTEPGAPMSQAPSMPSMHWRAGSPNKPPPCRRPAYHSALRSAKQLIRGTLFVQYAHSERPGRDSRRLINRCPRNQRSSSSWPCPNLPDGLRFHDPGHLRRPAARRRAGRVAPRRTDLVERAAHRQGRIQRRWFLGGHQTSKTSRRCRCAATCFPPTKTLRSQVSR